MNNDEWTYQEDDFNEDLGFSTSDDQFIRKV